MNFTNGIVYLNVGIQTEGNETFVRLEIY